MESFDFGRISVVFQEMNHKMNSVFVFVCLLSCVLLLLECCFMCVFVGSLFFCFFVCLLLGCVLCQIAFKASSCAVLHMFHHGVVVCQDVYNASRSAVEHVFHFGVAVCHTSNNA